MKINNGIVGGSNSLGKPAEPGTSGQSGRARAWESQSGSPDKLQLSNLSKQLAVHAADSRERTSRVVELSSAVAGGRYHVDAAAVSHKVIEDHMRAF